ncbi:zinc finger protein 467-like [Pectinophora gossypiella]|uniref:zinc finger protein 467-like n=1 Tax=Pectinophora gossypiella TaxID=13191 RepID=UPI00214E4C03|nr:zinc finger protein 467-like [Pectinophora gossypiella]
MMESCPDEKAALLATLKDEPCAGAPSSTAAAEASPFDVWIKLEELDQEREWPPPPPPPPQSPPPSSPPLPVNVKCEPPPAAAPDVAPAPVAPAAPGAAPACAQCGLQRPCRQHRPGRYPCQQCGKAFQFSSSLSRHQQGCCGPRARRPALLRAPPGRHQRDKPYACEMCDMRFKHKCTLVRHGHGPAAPPARPLACAECGKRVANAHMLAAHMRTHTKEQPYECPICLKRFSHKHNMQRHALNHNKVKHLTCNTCNKQFPRESRLKYHMRVHWEDNKPFKCDICPKSYSHKQNIQRHYAKKHPNVEFMSSETDAALANKAWDASNKPEEAVEYIVPEDLTAGVKEEIVMQPELVMLKEGTCSEESSEDEDVL